MDSRTIVGTILVVMCSVTASRVDASELSRSMKALEAADATLLGSISSRSSWDCATQTDCTATNSTCVDGFCSCDVGYSFNEDFTSCLRIATAFGDECTENFQCTNYLLTGGACVDEVCVCGEGFHYIHGRCWPTSGLGEECAADVNCFANFDSEAMSCTNGICACNDGWYQREYRACRRIGSAVGDECAIDLDCQFENSYCDWSNFVCADSTAVEESTTEESTTTLEPETAEESEISSRIGRVDGVLVGSNCTSNDDCADLGNARCGSAGTCICSRAHFASTDLTYCVPELGQSCTDNDNASITWGLCRDGTWSCSNVRVFSVNNQICRKTTRNYNWSCLHDEQCFLFGPDASCQERRCLCNEGSHLVEEEFFCWVNRGLGESCVIDRDCYVEGIDVELSCSDSICSCPEGTYPASNGTTCKSANAEIGEFCEEDLDCITSNAVCIDSSCSCPDNFYQTDAGCIAGVNGTCTEDDDCGVTNSVCSDSVCSCQEDYVVYSRDTCVPASGWAGECQIDLQCSTTLENSVCEIQNSSGICTCASDYHYRLEVCRLKSVIGDTCTTRADCYLESDIERAVCRTGVCACDWDYDADSTTSCILTRSDATTFVLSTSIGLLGVVAKLFLT